MSSLSLGRRDIPRFSVAASALATSKRARTAGRSYQSLRRRSPTLLFSFPHLALGPIASYSTISLRSVGLWGILGQRPDTAHCLRAAFQRASFTHRRQTVRQIIQRDAVRKLVGGEVRLWPACDTAHRLNSHHSASHHAHPPPTNDRQIIQRHRQAWVGCGASPACDAVPPPHEPPSLGASTTLTHLRQMVRQIIQRPGHQAAFVNFSQHSKRTAARATHQRPVPISPSTTNNLPDCSTTRQVRRVRGSLSQPAAIQFHRLTSHPP